MPLISNRTPQNFASSTRRPSKTKSMSTNQSYDTVSTSDLSLFDFQEWSISLEQEERQAPTHEAPLTSSGNLSGWGSVASRKAYSCLSNLNDEASSTSASSVSLSTMKGFSTEVPVASSSQYEYCAWGYFVDTVES